MSMFKKLAGVYGGLRAAPHLFCYALSKRVLGEERAFIAASERIARLPGLCGIYARRAFYRRTIGGVGADVHIGFMTLLSKTKARIGDRVYIGRNCSIGWAEIGDDVMLADGVQILSGRHQHGGGVDSTAPPNKVGAAGAVIKDNPLVFSRVTIGRGAWLGAGAVVMADVGENAVVGAGAVVVKPVAAGAKVGGVPAKALGG